jgi:spore maturation protein CgeB
MIKHIDLFMPPNVSQYGVLHHFTKKMHEALLRLGVHSRILEAQKDNPKPFLAELFKQVPDCTLSFNGLLPDDEGRFFCDLIRIPHVACTVDSPTSFVALAKSPYTIITTVDRDACGFFQGLQAKNVLFMPHAVEKHLNFKSTEESRPYDVLMLSSAIDYEHIRKEWRQKFQGPLSKVLDDAAEAALADQTTSYVQAFVLALNDHITRGAEIDPNKIEFLEVLDYLESYIRGKDRVELVKAIKDARVDIFGSASSTASWKKLLGGSAPNVIFHDAVPYDQAIELMHKSKIVLNSCAWIKNGTHERALTALQAGAAVITPETHFMLESFTDGKNISFYRYNQWDKVNQQVNGLLADENNRIKIAQAGREQVLHHHTWDHRAVTLLKELPPILNRIKEEL